MNLKTKIILSKSEQAKVMDVEWILTKHRIIEKVRLLLQQQLEGIKAEFLKHPQILSEEIKNCRPKISKGENYQQLPFLILDYPATFSKVDIFALRTFFWWGNSISIHLLLSGKYLQQFKEPVFERLKKMPDEFYICKHQTAWEHHFEPENYMRINENHLAEMINKDQNFLKIALKFSLSDWQLLQDVLPEGYRKIIALLVP